MGLYFVVVGGRNGLCVVLLFSLMPAHVKAERKLLAMHMRRHKRKQQDHTQAVAPTNDDEV